MALLWNSLATRDVTHAGSGAARALSDRTRLCLGELRALPRRYRLDFLGRRCRSIGYQRLRPPAILECVLHWAVSQAVSPAALPFQENPKTGDVRISGTCASLAGLEKALREETPHEVELAIRRILLIHGVILTVGGIPLIYLGDEIGTLNDYTLPR